MFGGKALGQMAGTLSWMRCRANIPSLCAFYALALAHLCVRHVRFCVVPTQHFECEIPPHHHRRHPFPSQTTAPFTLTPLQPLWHPPLTLQASAWLVQR